MGLALYETATAPCAMSPSERMQRIDEAIAQYQWAISLHAENPDKVHNNLGNALKARGRVDEAMEHSKSRSALRRTTPRRISTWRWR